MDLRFRREAAQFRSTCTAIELKPNPCRVEMAVQPEIVPLGITMRLGDFVNVRQVIWGFSWLFAGIIVYIVA